MNTDYEITVNFSINILLVMLMLASVIWSYKTNYLIKLGGA